MQDSLGDLTYLSVDRMCMSLSRNSLNIWGQVEDRCTCSLVRNSCIACVAVGPTCRHQTMTSHVSRLQHSQLAKPRPTVPPIKRLAR